MDLRTALRIQPGEVVALVGGGGKSSLMFALAAELAAAGQRVVTTTTTRIFSAQTNLAPVHLVAGRARPAEIAAALEQAGHVLVTGPAAGEPGKTAGIAPEMVAELSALPGNPVVVVEADGARLRPFKAPGEHEPVIPAAATLVVPVAGAEAFGQPLSSAVVHRPEVAQALAGVPAGTPITPEVMAAVLAHPAGGLKNVPPAARVVVFINQVETPARLSLARELAGRLLAAPRVWAVALGAVQQPPPVHEVWGRVSAVVLAAGRSTRMGRPKPALPWGAAGTLLGAVIERVAAGGVAEVVVVTGAAQAEVEAAVAAARRTVPAPVRTAFNPDFATSEMARSLQTGLSAVAANAAAVLVALADQPHLPPTVVASLLERWRQTQAPVVVPTFAGRRGHPLLFDRSVWPGLQALPPSANPREFLQPFAAAGGHIERVAVDSDAILRDIDTPEDYAREAGAGG